MKKKIIIIGVISTLLILLIGVSIAYFAWTSAESIIAVTVSSGTGSCTAKSDNEVLLEPVSVKMSGRIIKLNAKQEMAGKAYITWDIVINSISGLKDKTFKYELVNSTTNTIYGTGNFENVSGGDIITLSNAELLDYNVNYEFTLYLWIDGTISNNPLTMANQVLDFDINCNITGTDPPTLAETISNLYTSATKTTVTNNSITYNYATEVGLMNDRLGGTTGSLDGGNIRYYGANPNNYIYFNCSDYSNQSSSTCELWRIIGVFDGKVKIIRNDSIGNYSWDNRDTSTGAETANGKNDWTKARLMKLLNPSNYYTVDSNDSGYGQSLYWNSESGTCFSGKNNSTTACDFTSGGIKNDTTRNMIEEVTWYLGGWNDSSVYSNQVYAYERGTTVYSGRPTVWTGKIGLMYPSDYGYATDLSQCSSNLYEYYNCRSTNYLFINSSLYSGWLLSPLSGDSYSAWLVESGSITGYSDWGAVSNLDGFIGDTSVYLVTGVRPTLFLNSELVVESGSAGTSADPYRISIN